MLLLSGRLDRLALDIHFRADLRTVLGEARCDLGLLLEDTAADSRSLRRSPPKDRLLDSGGLLLEGVSVRQTGGLKLADVCLECHSRFGRVVSCRRRRH